MNRKIIRSFFANLGEYDYFLLFRNEQRKRNSDFTCLALLRKEEDRYLYSVELRDEITEKVFSASEYIRPFQSNQKNVDIFNEGVAECARRLQVYLSTGQMDAGQPAFGILSSKSPEETAPVPPPYNWVPAKLKTETSRDMGRTLFFPNVLESKIVKRYKTGEFRIYLVTNVICAGSVQISHMLTAYESEDEGSVYAVAAEYIDPSYRDEGSHFLCTYDGTSHGNLGCKNDWGNISIFEKRASELMGKYLGIQIHLIDT